MKITVIKCDNPTCNNTAPPEDGGTARKPLPPYGWLWIKEGGFMGSGPVFRNMVVCSPKCLAPAIEVIETQEREALQ